MIKTTLEKAKENTQVISKWSSSNGKFAWYIDQSIFWFRIFGYGLHFKNMKKDPLELYSDRQKNHLKIFGIRIKLLKPFCHD